MSQDDWQTVVTRRELVAEQKAERKAQCHQVTLPKAERKSSWQSSNHAGDCVKRLHTDVRAAAAGFQDDWSAKAVRRAELKQEDPERAQMDKAAEARRKAAVAVAVPVTAHRPPVRRWSLVEPVHLAAHPDRCVGRERRGHGAGAAPPRRGGRSPPRSWTA